MISIRRATEEDTRLLSELARITFIESHGHSADAQDINSYISKKYNPDVMKEELADSKNIYFILFYNGTAAGYSKIIFNSPFDNSKSGNITKLERIYLLKEFYDLSLGKELFIYNLRVMKENNQSGVWLYVWKENQRAFNFYSKQGFKIIGSYDFKISETHSNPNHQLFLEF